jgi:hypothetical protein
MTIVAIPVGTNIAGTRAQQQTIELEYRIQDQLKGIFSLLGQAQRKESYFSAGI